MVRSSEAATLPTYITEELDTIREKCKRYGEQSTTNTWKLPCLEECTFQLSPVLGAQHPFAATS
eukprot:1969364-Amphidinium_carterae.2